MAGLPSPRSGAAAGGFFQGDGDANGSHRLERDHEHWLSSLWLGLVTPLIARVGRKLIEGVRNETIVHDGRALEVFSIRPRSLTDAIACALSEE